MCIHINRNNYIDSSRDNIFNGIASHISSCMDINHDKYMNHENDRMKTVKSIIGLSLWHDAEMKKRNTLAS